MGFKEIRLGGGGALIVLFLSASVFGQEAGSYEDRNEVSEYQIS